MSEQEIQTIKEDLIRVKGELSQICERLKHIEEILSRKRIVLFGNGGPGLVGQVQNQGEDIKDQKIWMNGWQLITNYEDFRDMKNTIKRALAEVDSLKKWVYIGIGGVWVITILLQIFGPTLISRATEIFIR